jgi:NAD(P)-dependent dehydrogenase (short-subunit alcohol dehydrogenase family)
MVQKGWGRVVFISSESACNIPADMIHYGVTKTAQLSGTRTGKIRGRKRRNGEQRATRPDNVRWIRTDDEGRGRKTGKSLEQLAKSLSANRPGSVIQRAATVEEVANMVVYVCSTQASATSGAALRVDGGVDDII